MSSLSPNDWFTIKELADGVYGIGEFSFVEEVLSYLIIGDSAALLIDSGTGFFDIKNAVQSVTDLPCTVLNTHSHFDHIGGNWEFSDMRLFDHPLSRQVALEGVPEESLKEWVKADKFPGGFPDSIPDPFYIRPFPYAKFFRDGDVISIASVNLSVLHTLGHTDDSVCFYEKDRGWLFAGDLIYDGPVYIDRAKGLLKYRDSLSRLHKLDRLAQIFPGHNSFYFSLEKLGKLRNMLEKMKTPDLEQEVDIEGPLRLVPC